MAALTAAPARAWRSFATATWLGWQIESNWTSPVLFAIYSIVKPLSLAGILVVMYAAVTRGNFESPLFAYMFLGNAFYMYVGAVMTGMAYAVVDDRERYQTLKGIYVAPIDVRLYLIGRGVVRFLTGSASVAVTIAAGVVILGLDLQWSRIDWGLLLASLTIGIVMLASLGLMLSSVMLLLPHHSWQVGEAVAGGLFLFSGAVFPLDVLPSALRAVGYATPLTYWLELLRRAIAGQTAQASPMLDRLDRGVLFAMLTGLTAVLAVLALGTFRWCDERARDHGLIDRTSNY